MALTGYNSTCSILYESHAVNCNTPKLGDKIFSLDRFVGVVIGFTFGKINILSYGKIWNPSNSNAIINIPEDERFITTSSWNLVYLNNLQAVDFTKRDKDE